MRTWMPCLLALAACGGAGPTPTAGVDNDHVVPSGGAPCFGDRATVTARELYAAATAGALRSCRLADDILERGGEGNGLPVTVIFEGDRWIAVLYDCQLDVVVAGIVDDRGIAVGDGVAAVAAAYPADQYQLMATAGLGGEAELHVQVDGDDLAWFGLDGMGPDVLEGDEALAAVEGQRVVSMSLPTCD